MAIETNVENRRVTPEIGALLLALLPSRLCSSQPAASSSE